MRSRPRLLPMSLDSSDYGLVFVGTPVWAFTFAPPLRTFFSRVLLSGAKAALFCTHKGGPGKTLANMRAALASCEVVGATDFCRPLASPECGSRAHDWAREIIAKATRG